MISQDGLLVLLINGISGRHLKKGRKRVLHNRTNAKKKYFQETYSFEKQVVEDFSNRAYEKHVP